MTLQTQRIYEHIIDDIADIKPIVEQTGIWFPLKLETGFVPDELDGDGLSMGYPVPEGSYSVVTLEKAVGALADDTTAMFRVYQDQKKSSAKSLHLDDYVTYKNWDNDPAYQAWQREFPAPHCDICEGACDNYHHWSHEKQKAHDKIINVPYELIEACDVIAVLPKPKGKSDRLLKTPQGDYIAHIPSYELADFPSYFYCDLQMSEQDILDIIATKQEIQKEHQLFGDRIAKNIQTLATIFGYKATQG